MAVHAANVHCLSEKNGRHQAPILPLLLSADVAEMPDNTSIPPPVAPQVNVIHMYKFKQVRWCKASRHA